MPLILARRRCASSPWIIILEKAAAQPARGEWASPTPAASGQTVDVDMPVFDYRRCKDEVQDGSAAQCIICLSKYDEAEQPALSLPSCRHNFHVECIRKWLRSHGRCPICSAAPFPSHAAPPARLDVVRVSVLVDPLR
ncbi:hypothetical protein SUGI_1206300 [Cryptomeria japonica]|nr:hypothetical protein SUGI_1206300 [Cryptomeria japonica]